MPGPIHEGIVALFSQYPALAFEVARRCGARIRATHREHATTALVFQDPGNAGRHFVADGSVLGLVGPKRARVVRHGLIVEVQLFHDPLKWIAWLIYRAGIRSRHRCCGWTMVISPIASVRARARQMFVDEPELCPLIVEPEMIPPIVDISQARRDPGMTILAAVMHARTPDAVACARAAVASLNAVPREHRTCYRNMLNACFTEDQMSHAMQELKIDDDYEPSTFEMESYSWALSRRKGLEEGRQEGQAEVCAALAATVITSLQARQLALTDAERARIQTCRDPQQLAHWLTQVSIVASADQLLA